MSNAEIAVYEKIKDIVDGRIYPLIAPDNEINDFIIYQRVSSERWRSVNAPTGLLQTNIQIDCYSQIYSSVKRNSSLVEQALDGFRGNVAYGDDSPQQVVRIAGISLEDDNDFLDEEEEPRMYRVSMNFLITYQQ